MTETCVEMVCLGRSGLSLAPGGPTRPSFWHVYDCDGVPRFWGDGGVDGYFLRR